MEFLTFQISGTVNSEISILLHVKFFTCTIFITPLHKGHFPSHYYCEIIMKPEFIKSYLFFSALFVLCVQIFAQWNTYPTYQEYVGYMEKWQEEYPQIAKLYDLGPSTLGTHRIYALRISDNVELNEAEPRYIQTATLHGDELLGFMFTLHTIDTLLSSYGVKEIFTKLIDYAELWFLPLCNPDATYFGGDSTVQGAIRRVDDIDLNSNWPCACMQENHKHFGIYDMRKPEVEAIMKVHEMYRFNLFNDLHSGTESVYWPYGAIIDTVCDEDWFIRAAKGYVDQVHIDCGNNGYMTPAGGDGFGNYFSKAHETHGTRMDFCTRFGQAKGFCIELSNDKILDESDLEKHWIYNRDAMFQNYEFLYSGVQGVVTDADSKEPVNNVNVTAVGHDYDSAAVFTDSAGYYLRFIEKGTYSFTFSRQGYNPETIENITIDNYDDKYEHNVELKSSTNIENALSKLKQSVSVKPGCDGVTIVFNRKLNDNTKVHIYNIKGKEIRSIPALNKHIVWDGKDNCNNDVCNGCYIVQVVTSGKNFYTSFVLSR